MTTPTTTAGSHPAPPPRSAPAWGFGSTVSALGLVWLLALLSAAAMAPLAGVAYGEEAPGVAGTVRASLWVVGALAPLFALAKAVALAAVAWAVFVLADADPRFRRLLGVLVTGEVILAAQGLWVAGILHLRGLGGIDSPDDLFVGTGLNVLFPDPSSPLGALSASVTPFHVAWVLFLAWGFSTVAGQSRGWAVAAALACWLPGTLLAVLGTLGG